MKYIFPIIGLVLLSCSGSSEGTKSDSDKMRDEVRSYLFLDDSVEVKTVVQDTISKDDVDGMLANVEENLNLIQQDIDTLESIIDTMSYQLLDLGDAPIVQDPFRQYNEEMMRKQIELFLAGHKLKMAELQAKKLSFQQSKRVMLHLKRSTLNSIGGYEILASYSMNGETIELNFLMDSDFKIVD